MIDEATLLDPFTSMLLNNFSNTTNSVLYLIGDSFQNGYSIYLDKIKLNYNISKFFTIRSPYLDVMFRSDNTAITNNNEMILHMLSYSVPSFQAMPKKEIISS